MNLHLAAYTEAVGTVTNDDSVAVLDEVLTRRSNHLIFTEEYDLLAMFAVGANMTRARFANAALTQKGSQHIWPLERSATIPDLPQAYDLRDAPLMLPQNEEITIEVTTDGPAMGTAAESFLMLLGTKGWTANFPSFSDRLKTRATAVVAAGTETTWTALSEITFERDLLNGVYAVVGASMVAANALAFRFRFPDQPNVNGRQHRPGGLVQDAIGNSPHPMFNGGLGEWGRFHTFTPPEVQVLADAAGGTYEIRLDLLYLGRDESLLRR